jgi:hypothetical protein
MKFENVSCSECGNNFGAGDHGYSSCQSHREEQLKFANHGGYSDIEPFEVIRWVSAKTIEIREMDATRDESVKMEFVAGGFAGHCVNQRDQKWNIVSNVQRPVIRIRKSGTKGWQDRHGRRFSLSQKPVKFYDYNF